MSYRKHLLSLITLTLLTASPVAAAAADVCADLRGQMMRLASSSTSDALAETRYVSALAQQNLELRKARTDQRRLKCGTGSIIQIGPDGGSPCKELSSAIERMQINLQILSDKLKTIRASDTREQLIDSLVREGCSLEGIITDEASHREAYLDTAQPRVPMTSETDQRLPVSPTGRVRTLCVRTCDGGFFPISSQSSATDFARDADLCQKMCPGVPTELYYQSLFEAETSEMVSAQTGLRYSEMPNAFTYRNRSRDSSCICNLNAYYQDERASSASVNNPEASTSTIEVPSSQPSPAMPAEAGAQRRPLERELDERALNVRKVGPSFLPPDHGTIDLRNPSSNGPQPLQLQ